MNIGLHNTEVIIKSIVVLGVLLSIIVASISIIMCVINIVYTGWAEFIDATYVFAYASIKCYDFGTYKLRKAILVLCKFYLNENATS